LIQEKDSEKGYKIVDIDKLSKKLNEAIDSFFNDNNSSENNISSNNSNNFKIAIIEGHLSHLCDIEGIENINSIDSINSTNNNIHYCADFKVIVLRLNPNILQNRLIGRNYSEEKIHENLEAEALGVCSVEAYENHGKSVNEIDTTNLDVQEVLNLVQGVLFDKKHFPVGNIDFIQWILD